MLVDISKITGQSYSSIIVLAVLAIVLLVCVINLTKKGIVKDLFTLVYIVGLVLLFVFAMPPAVSVLQGYAFIENLQSTATGVLKTIMDKIPATMAYTIIVAIAILIIFAIITKILNAIFSGAFRTKGVRLVKFFGFIYSLLFFFVISTVILEVASSPLLFKGGSELVNASQYVLLYKTKVTDPFQEVLYEQKTFNSVDSILIAADTSISTDEDYYAAHDAFKQVDLFLVDKEDYVTALKTDSAFDADKVVDAASNMCYFVKVVNLKKNFLTEKIVAKMKTEIVDWVACFEDSSGNPVDTFNVGSEGRTALANMSTQLGLTATVVARIDAIFVE